ncbi:hypothetical protein [Salinimonas chungwhensis]|uniref:hypothetical protein n=1 Tax=Salinimonas chungwhensis TaxID=265425 RepID=UPI00037C5040|nr:hypothetical protein [Salinimonas chungwhensis]
MMEVTHFQTSEICGASHIKEPMVSDRDLQEFTVSTSVGLGSGGSWWAMAATALAFRT